MMSITGTVGERYFDEEVVSPEMAVKMFGMPLNLKAKDAVFTMLDNKVKDDPRNKMKRFPPLSIKALVSGSYKGSEVEIRYYTRKVRGAKGEFTYFPDKIRHKGLEVKRDVAKEKELVTFLALCGLCKDSTIKTAATKYYQLTDKAKNAALELSREGLLAELIVTINQADEHQIKRWSHAIELNGKSAEGVNYVKAGVRGVRGKTITELKTDLIKLAKKLPEKFNEAIRDQDVLLRGIIREAEDSSIIRQENRGGGNTVWRWADEYNGGSDIVGARPGQSSLVALYNHIVKAENFDYFISEVNNALGYANAKEQLSNIPDVAVQAAIKGKVDINSLSNSDLVKLAQDKDKLYFNRNDSKVYLIKDGVEETKALHVVKDKTVWREELAEALEGPKKNKLISNLK